MGSPLFSVAALRAIEQAAQCELPAGELMTRAGRAAARSVDALAAERRASICIVAGPGNNGGDGFVLAHELAARGHDVVCALIGAPQPSAHDARAAFERYRASGGRVLASLPEQRFDVVVDALFGIGLARPLQGEFLAAAHWIARHGDLIVAVDVPSGLDADRGAWVGDVAGVHAGTTITFIGDKPGLHTGVGLDAAGRVEVASLGVTPGDAPISLVEPADFAGVTRPRRRDSHKGTFGNAAVVGGGAGMVGAPLLAGRAALRLGAGRVYVDCIGAPEFRVDPMQPELMFRPYRSLQELDVVVAGCGLGTDDAARSALAWAMQSPHALVVDADGLNLLADDGARSLLVGRTAPTVLTPHPLEAARMLQSSAHAVQADRLAAAATLAREFGAIVVLKGAGSVLARPDGRTAINPTGSPALATAGTGDVLAGMLGALLAQDCDPWEATLAAVWLHGEAVRGVGDSGIVASEIAPRAAAVLQQLRERC